MRNVTLFLQVERLIEKAFEEEVIRRDGPIVLLTWEDYNRMPNPWELAEAWKYRTRHLNAPIGIWRHCCIECSVKGGLFSGDEPSLFITKVVAILKEAGLDSYAFLTELRSEYSKRTGGACFEQGADWILDWIARNLDASDRSAK